MSELSNERLAEMKSRLDEQVRLLTARLSKSSIPEDGWEFTPLLDDAKLKLALIAEIQQRRASVVMPEMEQLLVDAFLRGESWRRRNGMGNDDISDWAAKAACDYADATLSALSVVSHETGEGETAPKPRGFAGWKDQLEYLRRIIQGKDEGRAVETIDEMLEGFADVAETEAINAPTDEAQGVKRGLGAMHATLQRWRDEDHEEKTGLTREQVIEVIEEHRATLSQLEAVERERDEYRHAVKVNSGNIVGQLISRAETAEASLAALSGENGR